MDYPHAPWWNYAPCTVFNPNPCAVVASAMILYGTDSQKQLGFKIADDCLNLLIGDGFCGDHDTLNIQALVEQLSQIHSPLVSDELKSNQSCPEKVRHSKRSFDKLYAGGETDEYA